MDITILTDFLNYAAMAIDAVGIIIILYGCALTTVRIVAIELSKSQGFQEMEKGKRGLIQRIILALDFFVAADLLRLVVASGLDQIYSLALIVAIRTVLNWSLSKEMEQLHKDNKE